MDEDAAPWLFLCDPQFEPALLNELGIDGGAPYTLSPGWIQLPHAPERQCLPAAFARQTLSAALEFPIESVKRGSKELAENIIAFFRKRAEPERWRLHVIGPDLASSRVQLIEEHVRRLLKERRRLLFRTLSADTAENAYFEGGEALVQIALVHANKVALSIVPDVLNNPVRPCLSPFAAGSIAIPEDRAAPSRAYRKLLEAQLQFGFEIQPGQSCVDLGASPGGWSYVALRQGARVLAIDRSELRADLMAHPALEFLSADAFRYVPPEPVDWLLSDVVAFPERIRELTERWLSGGWCRYFCVTVKFRGDQNYSQLIEFKGLLRKYAAPFFLRRLGENKNEVTMMGACLTPDQSLRAVNHTL